VLIKAFPRAMISPNERFYFSEFDVIFHSKGAVIDDERRIQKKGY